MKEGREEKLLLLRSDLKQIGDYLMEIVREVIELSISEYPLFIAHREDAISLGKPIIIKEQTKTNWSYNASVIEELVRKGFLLEDKLDEFKKVYKDPARFVCYFVVDPEHMDFVWAPYDLDEDLR